MKKLILLFIFILLGTCFMSAQSYTNVTALLTDSNGQPWANAIVTATLVPPFGNTAALTNLGTLPEGPQATVADGTGQFTLILDDNTVLTPRGSTWKFTICPNATVKTCSNSIQVVFGATMDLSASISADISVPVVMTSPTIYRAYIDNEVTGGQGAIYWRTTDNTLRGFNGVNWVAIGTGGGGGGSSVWSDLLSPTSSLTLLMNNFSTTFNMGTNTGTTGGAFSITDATNNTGTNYLFQVKTGTSSTAKPASFCVQGTTNCIEFNASAVLQSLGTGQIIATSLNNTSAGVGMIQLGSNGAGVISAANTVSITGNSNKLYASENAGTLSKVLLGGQITAAANNAVQSIAIDGTVTSVPLSTFYTQDGTQHSPYHVVADSISMTANAATVTLTGAAAFTSSITYNCTVSDTGTTPTAVNVQGNLSGNQFTIKGTSAGGTDIIRFVCAGY